MSADEGYICDGASLFTDITVAFGVSPWEIKGGPGWIRSQRWDIEAKADHPYSLNDLHIMLEHALEDRFGLKLRHETRMGHVLRLEVANGGPKLKPHVPSNDSKTPPIMARPGGGRGRSERPAWVTLTGTNVSMNYLAFFLSQAQATPVIDRTGLQGHYDITVRFAFPPRPPAGERRFAAPNAGTLFEALPRELGLRVVGGKGPVGELGIESAHKPTPN
jgi:uncharacterized protein (TIGR03435 family)